MPALADISGKAFRVGEQVIIEGSLLVFYRGEWEDDGERTALGRLRDQSQASQNRFKEQITNSLTGLQHKNVLGFFGYITIEDIVYSVNPWIENGNIREYIQGNPGADCLRLLSEVASGVEFLHERGIVHGDLCGKAVLINGEGRAVVSGFGLSECSNTTLDLSRARWFAPERVTSASVTLATKEGDIWSFGMLCLEVFTGEDPYSSRPDLYVPVLLNQGETPEHPGSKAVGLSLNMWEVMQSCWKIDPSERPSMNTILSRMRGMRPRRTTLADSRQQSSGIPDPPFFTPISRANDFMLSAEPSFRTAASSPEPSVSRTWNPPIMTREPILLSPMLPTGTGTVDEQPETEAQSGHLRRVSNTPSTISRRLSSLIEVPVNFNIPSPPSAYSQFLTFPRMQSQARPYTPPSPSTPAAPLPPPPIPLDLRRQYSVDSSSSQSTSSTGESGPRLRWPFKKGPKRSQTAPYTSPDVIDDALPPLPANTPSSDTLSLHSARSGANPIAPSRSRTIPAPQSPSPVAPKALRSASLLVPLPQSRRFETVSPVVSEFLEKVASDSDGWLRPAADGSVLAGNLEGFVTRAITGTADKAKDAHFMATLLTIYQLFATNERLFEVLKRRFGPTGHDPDHIHSRLGSTEHDRIRSRYDILTFIESWVKRGFEDEELKCSARLKDFVLSIRGSGTMEEKARELANLIGDPDYILLRQPGISARLQHKPAERPQDMTSGDLAVALTVVEGERFGLLRYWDYVIFTRGRSNSRRIEVFNTVHDLITVWVKRSILQSDDLGERMKKYEEWIHVAQACRSKNNLSSAAAIVVALTSPVITDLALTCKSKARPILYGLARELSPTDGVYQNTLEQMKKKELIPWLDPLLSSLNSTFTRSDLIVEVGGHPLIDFKQCIKLAEQIDFLVQYSPPRVHSSSDVLSYVEFSLNSSAGDDVVRLVETRSAKLVTEEQALFDRWERNRLLGIAWSPYPRRK